MDKLIIVDDNTDNLKAAKQAVEEAESGLLGAEVGFQHNAVDAYKDIKKSRRYREVGVITDYLFNHVWEGGDREIGRCWQRIDMALYDYNLDKSFVKEVVREVSWWKSVDDAMDKLRDAVGACQARHGIGARFGGALMLYCNKHNIPALLTTDLHRHARDYSDAESASIDGIAALYPLLKERVITINDAVNLEGENLMMSDAGGLHKDQPDTWKRAISKVQKLAS